MCVAIFATANVDDNGECTTVSVQRRVYNDNACFQDLLRGTTPSSVDHLSHEAYSVVRLLCLPQPGKQ
ncbi:hypothetical protein LSAT2_002813 [Lamellibrachia satsuma]|nr:hypothetical protein LSAT2_002813 [Lamellibrachia satsuma]